MLEAKHILEKLIITEMHDKKLLSEAYHTSLGVQLDQVASIQGKYTPGFPVLGFGHPTSTLQYSWPFAICLAHCCIPDSLLMLPPSTVYVSPSGHIPGPICPVVRSRIPGHPPQCASSGLCVRTSANGNHWLIRLGRQMPGLLAAAVAAGVLGWSLSPVNPLE